MELRNQLRQRLYMLSNVINLQEYQEKELLKFFEDNFESLGYQYVLTHEALHRDKEHVPEIKAHYKKTCGYKMGEFLVDIVKETSFHEQGSEFTKFEAIVYKGKK